MNELDTVQGRLLLLMTIHGILFQSIQPAGCLPLCGKHSQNHWVPTTAIVVDTGVELDFGVVSLS